LLLVRSFLFLRLVITTPSTVRSLTQKMTLTLVLVDSVCSTVWTNLTCISTITCCHYSNTVTHLRSLRKVKGSNRHTISFEGVIFFGEPIFIHIMGIHIISRAFTSMTSSENVNVFMSLFLKTFN
jgi:hypothetical protein